MAAPESSGSASSGRGVKRSFDEMNTQDDDVKPVVTSSGQSTESAAPDAAKADTSHGSEGDLIKDLNISATSMDTSNEEESKTEKGEDTSPKKQNSVTDGEAGISDHMSAKSRKERQEQERLKMQYVLHIVKILRRHANPLSNCVMLILHFLFSCRVLVSNFSEQQLNRYEMYRRAAFPKAAIKRVIISH